MLLWMLLYCMGIPEQMRSVSATDKVFVGLVVFLLSFNSIEFYIWWNKISINGFIWKDIFGIWSPHPYRFWGIITSVYSHAGIFHLAVNLTSITFSWILLRNSTHPTRTSRFVLVFCTLIGFFTSFVMTLAIVFYFDASIFFVGSSTFAHGLLLFSLIIGDFTFLETHKNTIAKIGIGGWLIGYEMYKLVQNGIVISSVAHSTSFLFGLIMVWIWAVTTE